MKRVRRQKTKNARIIFKQRRNIILAIIIMLCLFAIYGFNRWTRSEILKTTTIKFIERESGNEIVAEVDVHKMEYESGPEYYILLPEEVNGYSIKKVVNFDSNITDEEQPDVDDENQNNTNINNTSSTNTVSNIIEEDFGFGSNSNLNTDYTNTSTNNTSNRIENVEKEEVSLFDKIINDNENNNDKEIDNKEDINTIVADKDTNTVKENTITNEVNENTVNNNVLDNNTNTVNNDFSVSNTISKNEEIVENDSIVSSNVNDDVDEDITVKENFPGSKIFLTEEEVLKDELVMEVVFDSLTFNSTRLYNRDLTLNTDNGNVEVSGYIPFGYNLSVEPENITEMESLKSDVDELKDMEVLAAYDIKLVDANNNPYQPIDYNQVLNVSFTSDNFVDKLIGDSVKVIHINETEDEIIFEKMDVTSKTNNSITCRANEFSTYLVLKTAAISNDSITIYDYERDFNYYTGKNFTDTKNPEGTNTYTTDNLAKVNVNYYSYDTRLTGEEIYHPSAVSWVMDTINYGTNYRTYYVYLNSTFNEQDWIDTDRGWEFKFSVETDTFNLTRTQAMNANSNYSISYDSATRVVTIRNQANQANWNSWTVTGTNKYQLYFELYFDQNGTVPFKIPENTNVFMVTAYRKYNRGTVGIQQEDLANTAYNDCELQSLISYTKAVPIENGKISFELIDNPFLNRPKEAGFDGWLIIDDSYSSTIALNSYTKVQTLTANIGSAKEVTINLYPNWKKATVIYVDTENGSDDNDGLTANTAVASWEGIKSRLDANARYATNASNRELNFVYLYNGQLNDLYQPETWWDDPVNPSVSYTITSLCNGVDRRAYAKFRFDNTITLDKDLQIDFVHVNARTDNNSAYNTDEDGSGQYGTYVIANGYNFRIGRGLQIDSTAYEAATVTQVFGGLVANNQSTRRSYKTVVESGRYSNLQVGRGATATYTANGLLVCGSDYDRAKEDDSKLEIHVKVSARTSSGTVYPEDTSKPLFHINIKSGEIGKDYFDEVTDPYAGIYVGAHGTQGTDRGERRLTVEGGKIGNIVGGLSATSSYLVNTKIYVMGGEVQNIVGGAGYTVTYGSRIIQVTDGDIVNCVNGGSNGYEASSTGNNNGNLDADVFVYIGGNAEIGTRVKNPPTGAYPTLYGTEAGCVLAAGNGNEDAPDAGRIDRSTIIIDGKAQVYNSVYGGGNYGYVDYDNNVDEDADPIQYIDSYVNKSSTFDSGDPYMITNSLGDGYMLTATNNTVSRTNYNTYGLPSKDWVFEPTGTDGYYYIKNIVTNTYLNINYAYRRESGRLESYNGQNSTQITGLDGATLSLASSPMEFRVYTSGTGIRISRYHEFEYYTREQVRQGRNTRWVLYKQDEPYTVTHYLNLGSNTLLQTNTATVYALDYVKKQIPPPPDPEVEELDAAVRIRIYGGEIRNNVYGGANRNRINGHVDIKTTEGIIGGAIYGGSNTRGTVTGKTQINISGGTIGSSANSDAIFGGGLGTGTVIGRSSNIYIDNSENDVEINGIVYGGSAQGSVTGDSWISVKEDPSMTNKIKFNGTIFGGGKGTTGDPADTGGYAKVSVDGGDYSGLTVFGGCNVNGTIGGEILVKIGETTKTSVDYVYGAGNNAAVTNSTTQVFVWIYKNALIYSDVFNGGNNAGIAGDNTTLPRAIYLKGIVNGNVYGGCNRGGTMAETFVYCLEGAKVLGNVYGSGFGDTTSVTGDTYVNISSALDDGSLSNPLTTISGNVYGGGAAAPVNGNTVVELTQATAQNVFGGGEGETALVGQATNVTLTEASISNDIYGGGDAAPVTKTTTVTASKTKAQNVYGGGRGNTAIVRGIASIIINNESKFQKTYGGGAAALLDNNTETTVSNSTIGTVYGGGANAQVSGYTTLNISNSTITDVYGGGEGNDATVVGQINAIIKDTIINNNVYGGGNNGKSNSDIYVTMNNTKIANEVYGAGQGTNSTVTGNTYISMGDQTTVGANVFGGGAYGPLTGNTSVIINEQSKVNSTIYGGGNNAVVTGNTSVNFSDGSTVKDIFGGGNNADVTGTTVVKVLSSTVSDYVFGGGNVGSVGSITTVTIDDSEVGESVFGAGKGADANVYQSKLFFQNNSTTNYVYGGGDQGKVTNEGTDVTIDNSLVKKSVYGGGNGASDGTAKGRVTGDVNLIVKANAIIGEGTVKGEDGKDALDIYNEVINNGDVFGGGRGKTALVAGNINVDIDDSTINYNVYGGGDNGDVSQNTNVRLTNSIVNGSAFGAGNGIPNDDHLLHIARVSGNSSIIIEGTTQVAKNVFAGGNAAKTGIEYTFNPDSAVPGGSALAIVEISGGTIGRNVYGGANASIVMGNAVVNIGEAAINEYHGGSQGYIKDDIIINGEIYGAGEAIKIGNEGYENSEFSVTQTTDINIDGAGYNQQNGDVLQFSNSVYGSGNASRPITPGSVTIRNFGTDSNPYRIISIQRAGDVRVDKSVMYFAGTVDSTASFPDTMYSLNMLEKLVIKNNTTIYMRYGANQVKEFWSVSGDDDDEKLAQVTIPVTITGGDGKTYKATGKKATDATGKEYFVINKMIYENDGGAVGEQVTDVDLVVTDYDNYSYTTDNRLYAYSGVNIDIALTQTPTNSDYGNVNGMTYFGIFKEAEGSEIYKGMFDETYAPNGRIEWVDRDYNRSYVQGKHKAQHDYFTDGFYTMFEQLQVELDPGEEITKEIYEDSPNNRSISYMDYITPTPEDADYYMWYAGPDSEVYYYNFNLVASKFSTLGTKLLTLDGIEAPNATIKMKAPTSNLIEGVTLVDHALIPNVNPNEEQANNMLGLAMKTTNTGWAMNGTTDFYADASGASRSGDEVYILENSSTSPAFQFFLYHSNNITKDQELGTYRIEMDISWKKNLTRGGAKIIIDIGLQTAMYEGNYYNAAMAPGRQHELFASTTTNISTESCFSAFFEMSEMNFKDIDLIKNSNYPDNAYRQLSTSYQFPAGTTITMLDISDNENPEYYYYIVTDEDVDNNKKTFNLKDFLVMGSTNKTYDEPTKMNEYIDASGYQYECFIFTVDFANADFGNVTDFVVTEDQSFTLTLYGNKVDEEGNIVPGSVDALYAVLQDQQLNLRFGIYNTESLIDITKAELTRDTIYPGTNTDLNLDISYSTASMEEGEEDRVYVHDTRYFDQKMGAKITLYEDLGGGVLKQVPGSSLLGTYYTISQVDTQGEEHDFNYYPRADGTTRIKLAEKVSNLSTKITINTENSTLNGNFVIKIESFGSADGIYFGLDVSDEENLALTVVDNIYGLNSVIPPNETIVDMTTGHVLEEDTGYVSSTNNKVTSRLEYTSGLDKPFLTVKLLRRKYDIVNSLEYELVDMKDYVESELENVDPADPTVLAREYVAVDTATIDATAPDEDDAVGGVIPPAFYDFTYEMGEDLVSGTYKVVYSLYDVKDIETVEYDSLGNEISREMKTTYQFIGDTFSYIVIK